MAGYIPNNGFAIGQIDHGDATSHPNLFISPHFIMTCIINTNTGLD